MVNGAPGSAWASLLSIPGADADELTLSGAPAFDDPTPLDSAHLFDLASLTKIYTAVAALRLVDAGILDLDAPVGSVLRAGTGEGAEDITLRHLLTHTSGLPAEAGAWRTGVVGDELKATVLQSPLRSRPGTAHRYSDVGFIVVGELIARVSHRPLSENIADVAAALGASTLTWAPPREVAVATELQPHRGLVRASVHDELAHALEDPAGHAGLFGTVHDVAALARMIRDDGTGPGGRVLSTDAIRQMTTPAITADAGYGQAVGLRVRDADWMGDLDAVGHTGFTGTCFAVTSSGGVGVLLTNRVHPTREDADITATRREFLRPLAGSRSSSPAARSRVAKTNP